jgi:hypothetical protein
MTQTNETTPTAMIAISFPTPKAARTGYLRAHLSPFGILEPTSKDPRTILVLGRDNVTAQSLVAWGALNLPGASTFEVRSI